MFAEQPSNAARITEIGAELAFTIEDVTVPLLHEAVSRVLEEPSFRSAARGAQRRALALPPLSQIAADLEELSRAC